MITNKNLSTGMVYISNNYLEVRVKEAMPNIDDCSKIKNEQFSNAVYLYVLAFADRNTIDISFKIYNEDGMGLARKVISRSIINNMKSRIDDNHMLMRQNTTVILDIIYAIKTIVLDDYFKETENLTFWGDDLLEVITKALMIDETEELAAEK